MDTSAVSHNDMKKAMGLTKRFKNAHVLEREFYYHIKKLYGITEKFKGN